MRLLAAALVLLAVPAWAQTPGAASFRVYEKGAMVGTVQMTLHATADGWRLQGTSRIDGEVPVAIVNLDLYYDETWSGRFMTMEMKRPDDVLLHVAVVGATTRTDIVRATEARFRANSVSPDTIFLPDRAYGAYEAVAARLNGAFPGFDIPLFVPPFGETRASVDAVAAVQVRTAGGTISAKRYTLTEIRQRPTPVEIWIADGRLLRLELPLAGLSVRRSDLSP